MRNLLRSPVIAVGAGGPGGDRSWARRLRSAAGLAVVLLVAYGGVSLFGLFRHNPFIVAVEAARTLGGWDEDQVHFERGHYGYRLFYSDVWAELWVDSAEGRRPVRIELRTSPFGGWRVRSLEGRAVDPGVRLTSTP